MADTHLASLCQDVLKKSETIIEFLVCNCMFDWVQVKL